MPKQSPSFDPVMELEVLMALEETLGSEENIAKAIVERSFLENFIGKLKKIEDPGSLKIITEQLWKTLDSNLNSDIFPRRERQRVNEQLNSLPQKDREYLLQDNKESIKARIIFNAAIFASVDKLTTTKAEKRMQDARKNGIDTFSAKFQKENNDANNRITNANVAVLSRLHGFQMQGHRISSALKENIATQKKLLQLAIKIQALQTDKSKQKKDIDKLIEKINNIMNSNATPVEQHKQIVKAIEDIILKEAVHFTKPFLGIGREKSPKEFEAKLKNDTYLKQLCTVLNETEDYAEKGRLRGWVEKTTEPTPTSSPAARQP